MLYDTTYRQIKATSRKKILTAWTTEVELWDQDPRAQRVQNAQFELVCWCVQKIKRQVYLAFKTFFKGYLLRNRIYVVPYIVNPYIVKRSQDREDQKVHAREGGVPVQQFSHVGFSFTSIPSFQFPQFDDQKMS